jgi:anti-sigma regulatory factor (Ser/Thr protein kinase)
VEITHTFTLSPRAPALARQALRALARAVSPGRLADLQLIASELVANAVRHSGLTGESRVKMTVRQFADRLRIEVVDRGRGFSNHVAASSTEGSFGLHVVDQLADQWGSESGAETRVWAELPIHDH